MPPEPLILSDSNTGVHAKILVGRGFNCYQVQTQSTGIPIDLIWAPEGFSIGRHPAYAGGIPILFPFPGRIGGRRFRFEDKHYVLPGDDGLGNALHGFVCNRPWRLIDHGTSHATGRFRLFADAADLLDHWPADFEITVRYELLQGLLRCDLTVRNTDWSSSLPYGLGLHPYFRVPVGKGLAESCVVHVPADSVWELDEQMLPTGRELSVTGKTNLKKGVRFPDTELDHVFGGLAFQGHWCRVDIEDKGSERTAWMRFDHHFRCCVVYNPPDRQAISIEPYTCVPDPFSLKLKGLADTLDVLSPGEQLHARVEMGVERMRSSPDGVHLGGKQATIPQRGRRDGWG